MTTRTLKKTLSVLSMLVLISFTSCSSKENKSTANNLADSAILVTIESPSNYMDQGLNLSGQIEAIQTVNLSTRVMGYITYLKVKVGDHVAKGQLLVSISNDDILAKRAQTDAIISETESAMKTAKKDADRYTALYQQQSATSKEVDNVNLQYSSAKARYEAAKQMRNEVNAQLVYTNLTAPFSGIVTQKMAEAGNLANPGMPLLTIEQAGSYQVSASVPENTIKQIQQGGIANMNIKALNKSFNGHIVQINQSSQFTGGQYMIKLSIPETEQKGLYAGMYTNVTIPLKQNAVDSNNNTVTVPISAIEYKNQLTGIYTVSSNQTALLRWVRTGKTFGNRVEILSGLDKSESFISKAEGKLFNGATVKTK